MLDPERLHNYFKEHRELDMSDMSSYVKVDMDYDAFLEALALHFGANFDPETALTTLEATGKIHINMSESDDTHITTIKVED